MRGKTLKAQKTPLAYVEEFFVSLATPEIYVIKLLSDTCL